MGFGGISPWQLLIILVIVLLIFGTKKLRNFGGDLGGAIKGFKKAMNEDDDAKKSQEEEDKITDGTNGESASVNAEKSEQNSDSKSS